MNYFQIIVGYYFSKDFSLNNTTFLKILKYICIKFSICLDNTNTKKMK